MYLSFIFFVIKYQLEVIRTGQFLAADGEFYGPFAGLLEAARTHGQKGRLVLVAGTK